MTDDEIAEFLDEIAEDLAGARELATARDALVRKMRLLTAAVEAVLKHHHPVQLYDTTEDYRGNHKCPHDEEYDGDAHYEGDDGLWYCKSMPTVKVCSSCCDPGDPDLRAAWECPTYRDLLAALTGKGGTDG